MATFDTSPSTLSRGETIDVLVVGDDPSSPLESAAGIDVTTAPTVASAREAFGPDSFDCVVCAGGLSADGWADALASLRASSPGVPVIALTAD